MKKRSEKGGKEGGMGRRRGREGERLKRRGVHGEGCPSGHPTLL